MKNLVSCVLDEGNFLVSLECRRRRHTHIPDIPDEAKIFRISTSPRLVSRQMTTFVQAVPHNSRQ
jgi:hypothetical protein